MRLAHIAAFTRIYIAHTYVWKKLRFVSSRWPIKGPGSLTKRIIRKRWQADRCGGRRGARPPRFSASFYFLSLAWHRREPRWYMKERKEEKIVEKTSEKCKGEGK